MMKPISIAAALFTIYSAAVLHANGWTAGASSGVIDENDLGKIALNNDGSATIRSTISSTSAKIRFNITDVPGVEPILDSSRLPALFLTYRDNGAGAQVIATLKRVHIGQSVAGGTLGTVDVLATINSDSLPASAGWQEAGASLRQVDVVCCRTGLSFPDFAYIVEVQLIKHDATGNPGVLGVQFFQDQE